MFHCFFLREGIKAVREGFCPALDIPYGENITSAGQHICHMPRASSAACEAGKAMPGSTLVSPGQHFYNMLYVYSAACKAIRATPGAHSIQYCNAALDQWTVQMFTTSQITLGQTICSSSLLVINSKAFHMPSKPPADFLISVCFKC